MERIAGSVLDFASWHVLPFGMRLNKSVNNDGSGSVLADWLIDCGSALFVCEFDLNGSCQKQVQRDFEKPNFRFLAHILNMSDLKTQFIYHIFVLRQQGS